MQLVSHVASAHYKNHTGTDQEHLLFTSHIKENVISLILNVAWMLERLVFRFSEAADLLGFHIWLISTQKHVGK